MHGRFYAPNGKGEFTMRVLIIMLLSGAIGWGIHYYQYGEKPPCVKVELLQPKKAK